MCRWPGGLECSYMRGRDHIPHIFGRTSVLSFLHVERVDHGGYKSTEIPFDGVVVVSEWR